MLIQITNKCHEGCAHCLQCSNPEGHHMDETTFKNALRFARFLGVSIFVLSGGEPTEHPQFYDFCEMLNHFIKSSKTRSGFSITSNGTWFPDRIDEMKKLAKLDSYIGMQVYTNPKWYKDADYILNHKEEIESIPKVTVETTDIRSMQDLGRARNNEAAQRQIATNPYYMSCLNGHLVFKQIDQIRRLSGLDVRPGIMCKPMIDYQGNVHLSESCLCPSYGNVNDDYFIKLFKNLQEAKPCCKCALGKKFLTSEDVKIQVSRNLLGLEKSSE